MATSIAQAQLDGDFAIKPSSAIPALGQSCTLAGQPVCRSSLLALVRAGGGEERRRQQGTLTLWYWTETSPACLQTPRRGPSSSRTTTRSVAFPLRFSLHRPSKSLPVTCPSSSSFGRPTSPPSPSYVFLVLQMFVGGESQVSPVHAAGQADRGGQGETGRE